jgi:hypothetical protein
MQQGNKKIYLIETASTIPKPEEVQHHKIICIGVDDNFKWACMKCPCGCDELLTLSLMRSHYPNWSLVIDKKHRPTLSPSVVNRKGCKSHFWIRKGKIIWFKSKKYDSIFFV